MNVKHPNVGSRSPQNLNGHGADDPDYSDDGLDRSGCNPPFRQNYPVAGEEAWIAVIRRGGCTFNEKIRNVLALNASGVLIYDNEGSGRGINDFNSVNGNVRQFSHFLFVC